MGSCAKETSADRANAGGGGGGGSSSAAVLISGSLTAHQNAHVANTDLFFGSDELNLGGMDGDSEREMRTSSRRLAKNESFLFIFNILFQLDCFLQHYHQSCPAEGRSL
jgi:hypothetical protein